MGLSLYAEDCLLNALPRVAKRFDGNVFVIIVGIYIAGMLLSAVAMVPIRTVGMIIRRLFGFSYELTTMDDLDVVSKIRPDLGRYVADAR
jgi:phosphotransferase system  glucose/maltose/N-acetylglucosamine-specific IIC component